MRAKFQTHTWRRLVVLGVCLSCQALSAKQNMIPVIHRNGQAYVAASALARGANIAIKPLPGQSFLAACSGERCAPVKDFLKEPGETFVGVAALAKALGAQARFDEDQRRVTFDFTAASAPTEPSAPQVGSLVPDFRLPKLDGTSVALSDFRGKRVLINSWASW